MCVDFADEWYDGVVLTSIAKAWLLTRDISEEISDNLVSISSYFMCLSGLNHVNANRLTDLASRRFEALRLKK